MNYSAEQYEKILDKVNNIVSTNSDYKIMLQNVCVLLSSELKISIVIKDSNYYYYSNKNVKDFDITEDELKITKFYVGDENSDVVTVEILSINHETTADEMDFDLKVNKASYDIFIRSLKVIFNLIIKNFKYAQADDEKKRRDDVKNVLDKLSFSELNAVVKIFCDFTTNDETIIASKVAQKYDLTRSSIVNALRKLESAKIIDSYSLGVKGTHIKITNNYFIEEIKKLS